LASLQRYWEALEIINLSLRLAGTSLSTDMKEELRSLGARKSWTLSDRLLLIDLLSAFEFQLFSFEEIKIKNWRIPLLV